MKDWQVAGTVKDYEKFQYRLENGDYDAAVSLLLEKPKIKDSLSKEELRKVADFYESIILEGVYSTLKKNNNDISTLNSKLEKTINEISLNKVSSKISMEGSQ